MLGFGALSSVLDFVGFASPASILTNTKRLRLRIIVTTTALSMSTYPISGTKVGAVAVVCSATGIDIV